MIRTRLFLLMAIVNRTVNLATVLLAGLAAASMAATSFAAVRFSYESAPTQGLPGYTTFTVTATSLFADQPISLIDFIGDRDNDDPDTAQGFFGPMHQLNPTGLPTVFTDVFDATPDSALMRAQDSHFLFNTADVNSLHGFLSEGSSSLRAFFGFDREYSVQSLPIAQIVVRNGDRVIGRGFGSVYDRFPLDEYEPLPLVLEVPVPEPTGTVLIASIMAGIISLRNKKHALYRIDRWVLPQQCRYML